MAEGQSPEEEGVGHQNQHQLHQTRELQQLKQPNLQQVITVQHYQAPAPSNVIATVNPDSASSTTKEEEWVTKKKVELTTKRQIETRVKRQVVLEDGRVVEDSGPIVTTNTTEDTEKQESSTTEKRDLVGDGEGDKNGINRDKELEWSAPGTVATQEGLLREVKEKKVCSRQETSELLETEDVQHLGDITDQDYQKAVQGRDNDLRATLERCRRDTDATRRDRERQLQLHRWDAARNAAPGRVVHRSTKSRKVVDSEDSQRLHALGPDGKLITETRTTTEHEEIEGEEQPDSGSGSSHCEEDHKESSTQFARTKQQQLVDYYLGHKRIGGEIKYESENFEGDRRGAPLEHQPVDWDKMSARARASRQLQQQLDRKDALTRRPLDPDQEERTRKHETDRWLDSHFGSVSSDDNDTAQVTRPAATSSFINVTMKSSKSPVPATPPPLPNDVTNSSHHVQSYLRTTSMSPVHRSHEQTTSSITPNRSNQTNERYSYSRSHLDRSNLSSPVERPVPTAAATTSATSESRTWYSTVQRNGHGLGHSGHNGRAVVSSEEEAASPSPPVRPRRRRGQDSDKEISRQLIEAERWRSQHSLANGYKTPDHVTAGDATLGDVPGGYTTPNSTPPLPYNGDYPHSPSPPPHHSTPYRGEGRGYSPSPTPDHIHQRASPQLIDDGAGNKKKIFQRTRFAAEIPLVKPKPQGGEPATSSKQGGLGLGRSLRKLVNKLGGGKSSKQETTSSTTVQSEPRLHHHHQTSVYQQPVQRYYLGEDPFSGSSIYGREREYHAAVPRRRHSNRIASDQGGSNQNGYRSTSTLGRLSRSTGRLASSSADKTSVNARSGGVHTLPRKLHNGVSWQQQQNYRNQETSSSSSRLNSDHRSGSLINVSIVNKPKPSTTSTTTTFTSTLGPAKPARTYRSSLLRSKSFSAQANDNNGISMSPSGGGGSGGGLQGLHHSSNPQLHRLLQSRGDDSPLKSPGIINSISRRDASRDASRNLLVRRLIDRVPQLYDALHGNGSASQFGNTANGSTTQFGNVTSGSTTQFGNTVNGITTQFGNTSNGSTTQFGNTANGTTTQFGSGALNGSQLGNGQSSVWTTSTTTIENRRYTAPVDRRGSLSSGGGVVIEVRNGD